jgi:FAD/FMN-containing dehydrogenase
MTTNSTIQAARSLADTIHGTVLTANDDGYDTARTVWNGMVDHRPAAIVKCATASDVSHAIRFARDHDREVGIRSGGHSVVGHAVPDGGVMIDLTPMTAARIDPQQRTARVQGGALLGVLDREAQQHGLATTAGNVSHTGVGGLTLGGGMGWLARQYGLSCDNVTSFELVTADGKAVTASATENPDLFWGLRGGGGNFGVVTEFEFALYPVAGHTVQVISKFALDNAVTAFKQWRELCAIAPRQATFTAWVGNVDRRPQVHLGFVWVGDPDRPRQLISDFRTVGAPLETNVTEQTYLELQTMDDTVQAHAVRRYWKGHYLYDLPDGAIEAFVLRGTSDGAGDKLPNASFQAYGGAIRDVPDDDTAFSHRDTFVEFVSASSWTEPDEDDERIAIARRYGKAMEPFSSGAYVNVLTDEGATGVRQAYQPDKLVRLTALKDQWDPDNVFHLNHNITPTTPAP